MNSKFKVLENTIDHILDDHGAHYSIIAALKTVKDILEDLDQRITELEHIEKDAILRRNFIEACEETE